MNEGDIIKLIKQTVRTVLAQTLLGSVTSTDDSFTTAIQRFSTDSEIEGLRIIRPYGLASRTPSKTPTIVHPVNGDPSHLLSLGDFDEKRPVIEDGEVILYNSDSGQIIYLDSDGAITFGDYLPLTGSVLPTYRAKFASDGTMTIKNLIATFQLKPSGEIDLNGGTGASHGVGLGDVIESRLSALETALSGFISSYDLHMHLTAAAGPPSPPTAIVGPFVPVPTPAESITVKVST